MVSDIRLYELLKAKIGDKEAEAFVTLVETRVDKKFEDAKETLATKEDLAKLQSHLEGKINDLLKWLIVMWVTQLGAIVAIIKFMIH